jgi:Ser/Thr protein kinase RdoA (MazF antagonist)
MKGLVREIAHLVADLRRVPCHRDFTPRNWIVDDHGVVRVIDFGHSRPDLWVLDVEKVWSLHLAERADRADAFWDGYGHSPTDEDRAVLGAAAALAAVSTITWAREHGDAVFEAVGRRQLDRVAGSRWSGS